MAPQESNGPSLIVYAEDFPRLIKGRTFHLAHHTSHITHHTSHITHHTSHITHHASRITNHTSHLEISHTGTYSDKSLSH